MFVFGSYFIFTILFLIGMSKVGESQMIHERVIKSEFSHFQTLGSKCLLCPYVTFDISVLGALLIFVIYGAFKHIDVLDRNGSFFLLIKLYPSSMTLAHYRSLVE